MSAEKRIARLPNVLEKLDLGEAEAFFLSMISQKYSLYHQVFFFQSSTFALVVLRICNLLTIFNLLVFTMNEFIVIRYPLHYRRYFRRRAVCGILCCWFVYLFSLFSIKIIKKNHKFPKNSNFSWVISIIMGLGLLVPPSSPYLQDPGKRFFLYPQMFLHFYFSSCHFPIFSFIQINHGISTLPR